VSERARPRAQVAADLAVDAQRSAGFDDHVALDVTVYLRFGAGDGRRARRRSAPRDAR